MALITSPFTTRPSQTTFLKNQSPEKINLNECYRKIHNIFSENAYKEIPEWCEHLPTFDDEIFSFPFGRKYENVFFSSDYKVLNFDDIFEKSYPKNHNKINNFILILLERFAKELNLIGSHELEISFFQIKYVKGSKFFNPHQDWHYDCEAKTVMVMVPKNDFSYVKGEIGGLDFALNNASGPFPTKHHFNLNKTVPKDDHLSLTYPKNGAIIFNQLKGKVIHKRSELAIPESNAKRFVVIITLKDSEWK